MVLDILCLILKQVVKYVTKNELLIAKVDSLIKESSLSSLQFVWGINISRSYIRLG
jgi:hypothetical protein